MPCGGLLGWKRQLPVWAPRWRRGNQPTKGNPMKSNLVMNDLTALLRARNSLIVITTREEGRAERFTFDAAAAAGYTVRCWDVAQGVTEIDGKPSGNFEGCQDPGALLTMIQNRATRDATGERCAWILRDLPPWLEP